ncbi:uncharacterized protein BYT42DRAFT_197968 [Radiomyces spectabilis]|uniref:uncharacterized protein n=1 Tax=Radiomyces spectabilis TaxID=64574 RepID=UPI00221E55AB|nr:uncharacterized protein BYT42DRAFT_197968 [Radiomyces spectabilis]KAI8391509.1 hypothetical protein BYT42DRAFT_197968 [Radiomyces spectabilis]
MPSLSARIRKIKSLRLPKRLDHQPVPTEEPISPCSTEFSMQEHEQDEDDDEQNYDEINDDLHENQGHSFVDTLRIISKEAQHGQYADVFDCFFFNDKRCQNRALFMAARLKQSLGGHHWQSKRQWATPHSTSLNTPPASPITPSSAHSSSSFSHDHSKENLWQIIIDRLYTLNYIRFVLSSNDPVRQAVIQQDSIPGDLETGFAVRWALASCGLADETEVVLKARGILAQCIDNESRLSHTERDAMYLFHAVRLGLYGTFIPSIRATEPHSQRVLEDAVQANRTTTGDLVNPFDDQNSLPQENFPTSPITINP